MEFPSHPFWDFSLELYKKPGVADACLYLQDRYGLNVNLLLFCVWAACSGHRALSRAEMEQAQRRVSDWQREIVKPLREIRRQLGREPLGVPEFLLQACKPHIQTAELEAEHVEQLVLAALVTDEAASAASSSQEEVAQQNFAQYLAVAGQAEEAALNDNLAVLAGAAMKD